MHLIRFADLEPQLWKNGGGVTREIAALRRGQSDEQIVWRLSIADVVCDGPFSNFAGLTRILTVIKGKGIRLISAGGVNPALFGVPVEFDGGVAVDSELIDGAIRDLNVMFDARLCSAAVTVATGPARWQGAGILAIIGLTGLCRINGTHDLHEGDTLMTGAAPVALKPDAGGSALIVSLRHHVSASNEVTAFL